MTDNIDISQGNDCFPDVSAPKWFVDFEQRIVSQQQQTNEKFTLFLESIEDKIISIGISIESIKRRLDCL